MSLKQQLQELAAANRMKYFGIAPVERFSNMPEGHLPNDLLPKAKAVLVMGMVVPDAAIRGNIQAFDGLRHGIFTYINYGYNRINDQLDWAALQAIFHIEKQYGKKAYGIPAGRPRDEYLFMSAMSNRYSAVCAGLGEFGWSGFVLTMEDGPRVRWVTVITEAEIEPDPLYQNSKLCDRSKCSICVDACPTGALSMDEAVHVQIGGHRMSYSLRNKPLCRCATAGLVKGTPGRLQAEVPGDIKTMDEWNALSRKDNPWQRMEASHGNYCHRCMIMCPAGR
ncbi:MAG: hypothetical protein ACLQDI_25445 [Syntrophobacteraceae bacterium]